MPAPGDVLSTRRLKTKAGREVAELRSLLPPGVLFPVVVNVMGQLDRTQGCPESWSNGISGCVWGVFPDEVSVRVGGLGRADYPPQAGGLTPAVKDLNSRTDGGRAESAPTRPETSFFSCSQTSDAPGSQACGLGRDLYHKHPPPPPKSQAFRLGLNYPTGFPVLQLVDGKS